MNSACRRRAAAPAVRFAASYERLRKRALRAGPVQDREGLAILAQRGIAAWLDVLAALPAPAVPSTARAQAPLPQNLETRTTDILLSMVRSHMEGRAA